MQLAEGLSSWKAVLLGFSSKHEHVFAQHLWIKQRQRFIFLYACYCVFMLGYIMQAQVLHYWWLVGAWYNLLLVTLWSVFHGAGLTLGIQLRSPRIAYALFVAALGLHGMLFTLLFKQSPSLFASGAGLLVLLSLPMVLLSVYMPMLLSVAVLLACSVFSLGLFSNLQLALAPQWPSVSLFLMLGFSVVYFSHRLWRLEYLYQHFNSLQDSRNETAKADVKPPIQAPANLLEIASFEQFKRFSNQEIERSSRYQNAYSIVLIKVTHFSAYRDKLGAEEADKLLVKFAIFIQTQLRKIDLLARYENEQLLIGLPEAGLYQALDTAERIQQALEQEFWKAFPNSFHLGSRLTVASVESPLCSLDMLLKKATKAMNKQANTKTLSYGS